MDNLYKIRGQIERITFAHEENGFTIAKLKVQGEKELVTIVGNFPGINPGEILELIGEWSNHPKFGNQFKAVKLWRGDFMRVDENNREKLAQEGEERRRRQAEAKAERQSHKE